MNKKINKSELESLIDNGWVFWMKELLFLRPISLSLLMTPLLL